MSTLGQMSTVEGCFTCRINALSELPPRESVARRGGWRVAHAFGTRLPGWLVVVPIRHVTSLAELSAAEATELGPLLCDVTSALEQVVGCEKTYVALFAEAEGFSHVHFHVIPRMPDQAGTIRGPRVFGLLGASDPEAVSDADMDGLSEELALVLAGTEPIDRPDERSSTFQAP